VRRSIFIISMSSANTKSTLLIRRLYRSLLKTALPFTRHTAASPLRSPVVLHCLLHRTGVEDESWLDFLRGGAPRIVVEDDAETLEDSDDTEEDEEEERRTTAADMSKEDREMALFRTLLRDVMCKSTPTTTSNTKEEAAVDTRERHTAAPETPDAPPTNKNNEEEEEEDDNDETWADPVVAGQKRMQFPIHVDTGRLRQVIRREFRVPLKEEEEGGGSELYDLPTRQNVAFRAIRELNKKLAYAAELEAQLLRRLSVGHPNVDLPRLWQQQAARHVAPLPLHPPKSYLRPGAFLLAHPNMTGYFRRSVICILDHRSEEDDDDEEEEEMEENEEDAEGPPKESKVADAPQSAEDATAEVADTAASETTITTTTASETSETETAAIPLSTRKRRSRPKRRNRPSYGTYGLVINRVSVSPNTGKTLTLVDILRPLPVNIVKTFGRHPVREGGPVHMALQMIYQVSTQQQQQPPLTEEGGGDDGASHPPPEEDNPIDGTILPPIQLSDDVTSVAADSDKAVYFRGSILNAVRAVEAGRTDREDIAFFVGASCWSVGQLEKEMEHGFWLPCRGPTTLAQSGMCEHATAAEATVRPEADLWLSMLSACGSEEAKLALLLHWDDGKNPNGAACDS
jgi:putative AlgH/UPF0301 family transcriptional regulator